jgi:hypothetical protein
VTEPEDFNQLAGLLAANRLLFNSMADMLSGTQSKQPTNRWQEYCRKPVHMYNTPFKGGEQKYCNTQRCGPNHDS